MTQTMLERMGIVAVGGAPPTPEEIEAASRQFVRKISGYRQPSRANEAAFTAAVDELADAVGLSYDRMSHLFSATVGLPLRSYQLSRKMHAVCKLAQSGLSLTDIAHTAGFADSSHFSRVWLKAFGAPPSFFFGGQYVDVKLDTTVP